MEVLFSYVTCTFWFFYANNTIIFSNFSDLVRSGIREEFKDLRPVIENFRDKELYEDSILVKGVMQSRKQIKTGKGKILKNEKAVDKYFEDL